MTENELAQLPKNESQSLLLELFRDAPLWALHAHRGIQLRDQWAAQGVDWQAGAEDLAWLKKVLRYD